MTEQINDGGPAFPTSDESARRSVSAVYGGLTIRDVFAIAYSCVRLSRFGTDRGMCELNAEASYEFADAMLKARAT